MVIAIDVQGTASKWNVIKAIRSGWNDNTKTVLLNWKGSWYEINKAKAFGEKKEYKDWLENHIK
jgi:hypothetical protein